jgi:hypothetical protein
MDLQSDPSIGQWSAEIVAEDALDPQVVELAAGNELDACFAADTDHRLRVPEACLCE